MEKLSVFIITLNEEKNLEKCLESVTFADEVIVMDSGSRDGTKEIAQKFPNVHFQHQDWLGYSKQKQLALDTCSHEWCLSLDADEWIDDVAAGEIKNILSKPSPDAGNDIDGYYIKRYDKFLGQFPPELMKKDRFLRFFKKSRAYFKKVSVHEVVLMKDGYKADLMKGKLLHSGYDLPETYLEKFAHYAQLRADSSQKKASLLQLILIIPYETFRQLILKRRIFWGYRGLYLSYLYIWYAFLKKKLLLKNGIKL